MRLRRRRSVARDTGDRCCPLRVSHRSGTVASNFRISVSASRDSSRPSPPESAPLSTSPSTSMTKIPELLPLPILYLPPTSVSSASCSFLFTPTSLLSPRTRHGLREPTVPTRSFGHASLGGSARPRLILNRRRQRSSPRNRQRFVNGHSGVPPQGGKMLLLKLLGGASIESEEKAFSPAVPSSDTAWLSSRSSPGHPRSSSHATN